MAINGTRTQTIILFFLVFDQSETINKNFIIKRKTTTFPSPK